MVERVVVQVRCGSEFVAVTIHWKGGYPSGHEIKRSEATYAQLRELATAQFGTERVIGLVLAALDQARTEPAGLQKIT